MSDTNQEPFTTKEGDVLIAQFPLVSDFGVDKEYRVKRGVDNAGYICVAGNDGRDLFVRKDSIHKYFKPKP